MDHWDSSLSIASLKLDYEAGIQPSSVVENVYERIEAYAQVQPSVFIHLEPITTVLAAAKALNSRFPDPSSRPPLWGIPFSLKDSIDVAGLPTTAGCQALSFTPAVSAQVYQHCIDAGALFIGKTNLEQLATGMTGCRSPFGTLHSTWSRKHAVGGSSSGSAVSVAAGLVSFSLGSDTAGSIRVPALFNGLVGFKPTKGTVSGRGVFPACKHQDTAAFLASSVEDARTVWRVCKGFDRKDPFAKRDFVIKQPSEKRTMVRFGIPAESALEACSLQYRKSFERAVEVIQGSDVELVDLDWKPFADANELLYNASFVIERLTILPEGWFEKNKQLIHPVTRQIFEEALARQSTPVDVFRDLHKQAEYRSIVEEILTYKEGENENVLTVMIVPTTPFHPTIEEVVKDPIGINGKLGLFAHFANVLDLVGIALPVGSYSVREENGRKLDLPFGVTVLARAGMEEELLKLTKNLERVFQDMDQE